MAKAGLILRGAKGKVGGLVLSKGANGATIIREQATSVANPQTEAQATQRMKMAAACNFWRGLSGILDHSWEGVKYGNKSRQYFMKLALSAGVGVAAVNKGVRTFAALPFPVSQGSLPSLAYEYGDAGKIVINLPYKNVSLPENKERSKVIPYILSCLGLTDAQLTFVFTSGQQVLVNRVILEGTSGLVDDFDRIMEHVSVTAGVLTIDPAGIFASGNVDGFACIVSKYENNKWRRSSQTLLLSDEQIDKFYSIDAIQVAKEEYMKYDLTSSVSQEYLNEGNSRPLSWLAEMYQNYPSKKIAQGSAIQAKDGDIIYIIIEPAYRSTFEFSKLKGANTGGFSNAIYNADEDYVKVRVINPNTESEITYDGKKLFSLAVGPA